MKDNIVIYHKTDKDGFGACWSAWLKLKETADYLGFDYLNNLSLDFKNKKIYLLDVSLDPKKAEILKKQNNTIILIDHHLTSYRLKNLVDEFIVDPNYSAAVLAFQYFLKNKRIPKILKYIQDQDLWTFKLPYSKPINIVIDALENDFRKFNKFAKELEKPQRFKVIVKQGKEMLKYREYLVKEIISKGVLVEFEGHKVMAVNFASPALISHIGNELCKKHPPFSIVWALNGNRLKVSLRSNGKVNVAEIAEKYGGGGHRKASSFVLPFEGKLPWKIIQ